MIRRNKVHCLPDHKPAFLRYLGSVHHLDPEYLQVKAPIGTMDENPPIAGRNASGCQTSQL